MDPGDLVGGQGPWSLVCHHMGRSKALGAKYEPSPSLALVCMTLKGEGLGWVLAVLVAMQVKNLGETEVAVVMARGKTPGQPCLEAAPFQTK